MCCHSPLSLSKGHLSLPYRAPLLPQEPAGHNSSRGYPLGGTPSLPVLGNDHLDKWLSRVEPVNGQSIFPTLTVALER